MYLPFKDESFDGLFHFGGLNLFNNPEMALDEFVCVVKKEVLFHWEMNDFLRIYKRMEKEHFN